MRSLKEQNRHILILFQSSHPVKLLYLDSSKSPWRGQAGKMQFPKSLPGEDFIYSWYPIVIALVVGVIFGIR